jgi:hypothetical protein
MGVVGCGVGMAVGVARGVAATELGVAAGGHCVAKKVVPGQGDGDCEGVGVGLTCAPDIDG